MAERIVTAKSHVGWKPGELTFLSRQSWSAVLSTGFKFDTSNAQADRAPASRLVSQLTIQDGKLIDIRSSRASLLGLDSKILEGLCQRHGSRFLPSLLLWDKKGPGLCQEILASQDYYPYHLENELLRERKDEIAKVVASSGTKFIGRSRRRQYAQTGLLHLSNTAVLTFS